MNAMSLFSKQKPCTDAVIISKAADADAAKAADADAAKATDAEQRAV